MSVPFSIEPCRAEEAAAVTALAKSVGLTVDASAELAREHAVLLVARAHEGEAPVAFVLAWQVADEFELLDLGTDPAFRRRGVGRALLDALLERARAGGASAVYLEVRPSNAAALALYRAAGFTDLARRPRYYPDGEDALLLRYDVAS
jgi:ribosomal-protein-alanine N-acetyltransferase